MTIIIVCYCNCHYLFFIVIGLFVSDSSVVCVVDLGAILCDMCLFLSYVGPFICFDFVLFFVLFKSDNNDNNKKQQTIPTRNISSKRNEVVCVDSV